jgi:hypothetical protein
MSTLICPYCGRSVTISDDGLFARDELGDTQCRLAGDQRIFPLHGAVPAARAS